MLFCVSSHIIWFLLVLKCISFKWTLLLIIPDVSEGLPLPQSLAEHLSNTLVNVRSRNLTSAAEYVK